MMHETNFKPVPDVTFALQVLFDRRQDFEVLRDGMTEHMALWRFNECVRRNLLPWRVNAVHVARLVDSNGKVVESVDIDRRRRAARDLKRDTVD